MTRGNLHAVIALGAVLLLGTATACGTGGTTQATPQADPLTVRLQAALRETGDLPQGFSLRPQAGWKAPLTVPKGACRTLLAAMSGDAPTAGRTAYGEVGFRGDRLGEFAGIGLAAFESDQARSHLRKLGDAFRKCTELTGDDGTSGTRLTGTELVFDDLGDDSRARRFAGKLNGFPYDMRLVLARVGPTLVSLVHTVFGTASPARTEELARFAVERAKAAE
ncbi:hypothetical protein [Rhizohabitans arisaemae]|uniref:hypothetical protein n=1 Tax=Rhizohabitans arisaemae TaxID=2720610 RepID=UPI0024B15026|nr:hypothetical protein [Rhizohabitans arisaemae]